MNILEIKNLTLELGGKKILDNLSLELWEGHIHALVGANGAGKSTLSYTIMGLSGYRNFSGDILFRGKSIKNMGIDERARLGITLGWQEPARFEGLSVEKFLRASGSNISDEEIDDILRKSGLDPADYKRRAVDKTLSGGERKKVELASILAMKPSLVMLDEPDSGIDVASLENIFEAIKVLKENGTTVVLITHSLSVLEQAEHGFLICCGEVVEKGRVDELKPYFEKRCIPCRHPRMERRRGVDDGK